MPDLAIALPCFNRPAYLEQMLTSLLRCPNLFERAALFVGVDPSEHTRDIAAILQKLAPTAQVTFNRERLGVRKNPYAVLERAFEQYTQVIYLEDDLSVSSDMLELVDAYFRLESSQDLCLNLLLGGTCSTAYYSDPAQPADLVRVRAFNSLGWAASRDTWQGMMRSWWFEDDAAFCTVDGNSAHGWDVAIHRRSLRNGLRVVAPLLARAVHIGRSGGTHCSEAHHDRSFADLPVAQTVGHSFRLPDEAPSATSRAFLALLDENARALMSLETQRARSLAPWWRR